MGGRKAEIGTGFAARLKSLRESKGWSQLELAEAAGMNVGGVTKLEQGQREPGWSTVLKLSAALGVDCTAFADCDEVKQPEKPAAKRKPRKK